VLARRGLTLIELLVVVGAISLLVALSFPALMRARNQAQGAVCVQNLKTLSLAWLLYKDDSDDHIVGGNVADSGDYRPHDWVRRPTGQGTAIEREKEGIRQGALYRYVGGKVEVYRCPADARKLMPYQGAFRSYSVAGGANGEIWHNSYTPAQKYAEIVRPATKYVFVEESDGRGWNRGSWVLDPKSRTWVDPLAIWHSRARSTLGYADGHADIRCWLDRSTLEMSQEQEFFYPVPANEGEDLRFMLGGFPQKTAESSASQRSG
jgi:prepilin-type N-terminal cleavage/methylation domain-containing protein